MHPSQRAATFTESVIREMTRVAQAYGAINWRRVPGLPDAGAHERRGLRRDSGDINQYAITWGSPALASRSPGNNRRMYDLEIDPEREVTVTCGATEAMAATFLALLDPGDEVITPEPFYENYGPTGILAGARPVFVPLDPPSWTLDPERLRRAFTPRTRASSSTLRTTDRPRLHNGTRSPSSPRCASSTT